MKVEEMCDLLGRMLALQLKYQFGPRPLSCSEPRVLSAAEKERAQAFHDEMKELQRQLSGAQ